MAATGTYNRNHRGHREGKKILFSVGENVASEFGGITRIYYLLQRVYP